jgi:hypothetical protein
MFRYSEIVITCAGLGELVLYRTASNTRAQSFRKQMSNRVIFGAKPTIRDIISSQRKETGELQKAI